MKKVYGLFLTTIALTGCGSDNAESSEPFAISSTSSAEKSVHAYHAELALETYSSGERGIFPVASTLISGKKDAILVDAQFQNQYAQEVVQLIKKSGKNLKYIYISHSDPDYYFGTNEILKAFPHAKVVSTAQTAYLIAASNQDKLNVWKDQLGAVDTPERIIIPEALDKNYLELEGRRIDVQLDLNDSAHSFLWIPSLKTVLGGISVSYGSHLWLADTQGIQGIDKWIQQINTIQSLKPRQVIPGHYIERDFSPQPLDWIKGYLQNFKSAVQQSSSSADIIRFMDQKYLNLPDHPTLEMSAKVFTKEQDWAVASPYPPIGQTITVDFDRLKFNLDFKDNKTLTFTGAGGDATPDLTDTVQYTPIEIAKNVFMVYWHETGGDNVVHVQDYNRNLVYTNIAEPDTSFINLQGKISGVRGVIHEPELEQPLNSAFPALGQTLETQFQTLGTIQLNFNRDGKTLVISAANQAPETVQYTAKEVAKNVFLLYWHEPNSKRNVVQIHDYNNNTIYTNIAEPNGEFKHEKGGLGFKK